jgi:hypothetical protein
MGRVRRVVRSAACRCRRGWGGGADCFGDVVVVGGGHDLVGAAAGVRLWLGWIEECLSMAGAPSLPATAHESTLTLSGILNPVSNNHMPEPRPPVPNAGYMYRKLSWPARSRHTSICALNIHQQFHRMQLLCSWNGSAIAANSHHP